MHLQSLTVQDVGRFGRFTCALDGRLVGVVGANGAGKSTLLSAVHFAVTGDGARLGRAEAVSTVRTHPTEQPYASLTFVPEPGAEPAVLVRRLPADGKDGTRRLAYAGRVYAAQADIAGLVERWTGLPVRVLTDFVFVDQDALDAVVTDQPARRAEVLHRLFGFEAAARGRDAVVSLLERLPTPPASAVVDHLRVRAAEAVAAAREADLAAATVPLDDPAAAAADASLLAAADTATRAAADRAGWEAILADARSRLDRPPVDPADPDAIAEVRACLAAWDRYTAGIRFRAAAEATAAQAREVAARARRAVPPEPPGRPEPPTRLLDLRARKFVLETVVAAGDRGGVCPVCAGRLAPELIDLDRAAADLAELTTREDGFAAAVSVYDRAVKAHAAASRAAAAATGSSAKSEADVIAAAAATPPMPTIPLADAQAYERVLIGRQTAAAADAVDRDRAVVGAKRAAEALAGLPDPPLVPAADVTAARARVAARIETDKRRAALTATAAALGAAARSAVDAVDRAVALTDAADRLGPFRARLERLRDVLHRDAAPALAARQCLEELTTDLNRRLGHLGAAFRVDVGDDGQLTASYRDGTTTRMVTAGRASKGERAVLGLAWRLAVLDRYAPRAGVLCLDEPTTGLDRERVEALRAALEAWRPHGADRQFVIVTHERRLMSVFDTVVDLG